MWVISGISEAKSQNVSCADAGLRHREVRLGLGGVHQIRKLHRVLDEEDRDVVADEIPVAFVRVELHGEAAHVSRRVGRAALAEHRREAHEDRRLLADLGEQRGAGVLLQGLRALEVAMRRRPARVNDPLGDPFVVEVGDLLAEDEVFEQRRPAQAGLEGVLIVRDRHALIGRQRPIGRVDADAIQRTDRRVVADIRTAAPGLLRAVRLADGARPDDRIGGLDRRTFRRRQRGSRIVFGTLDRVERERGGQILRARHLLGQRIARPGAVRRGRTADSGAAVPYACCSSLGVGRRVDFAMKESFTRPCRDALRLTKGSRAACTSVDALIRLFTKGTRCRRTSSRWMRHGSDESAI